MNDWMLCILRALFGGVVCAVSSFAYIASIWSIEKNVYDVNCFDGVDKFTLLYDKGCLIGSTAFAAIMSLCVLFKLLPFIGKPTDMFDEYRGNRCLSIKGVLVVIFSCVIVVAIGLVCGKYVKISNLNSFGRQLSNDIVDMKLYKLIVRSVLGGLIEYCAFIGCHVYGRSFRTYLLCLLFSFAMSYSSARLMLSDLFFLLFACGKVKDVIIISLIEWAGNTVGSLFTSLMFKNKSCKVEGLDDV